MTLREIIQFVLDTNVFLIAGGFIAGMIVLAFITALLDG